MKNKIHTCYLCGHEGHDVTGIYYSHVGGQGDFVVFPVCIDKQACMARVERKEESEAKE